MRALTKVKSAEPKSVRPRNGSAPVTLSTKQGPPKPGPDLTETVDQSAHFARVLILDLQTAQADLCAAQADPNNAGKASKAAQARDVVARMWQARMGVDVSTPVRRRQILLHALEAAFVPIVWPKEAVDMYGRPKADIDKTRSSATPRERGAIFLSTLAVHMPGRRINVAAAVALVDAYRTRKRTLGRLLHAMAADLDCDIASLPSMVRQMRSGMKVKEST